MAVDPRADLHRLVDELPGQEIHAAKRYLEYLCDLGSDPILGTLNRAADIDEPLPAKKSPV